MIAVGLWLLSEPWSNNAAVAVLPSWARRYLFWHTRFVGGGLVVFGAVGSVATLAAVIF
jgi:hypothetical protein